MSYHIESGNVLFGTANVPAYAFVTTGGGLLQLERPDGNAALLEIDGNIRTANLTLLTAATAGAVATDSANALTSTAYDPTALGNASHLLTGVLPSARLTGPYANTTELDIRTTW
jgi:hypothetical protein